MKTIDAFHMARQLHEKCQEQKADLYMALVNFTKNLNKVVRDLGCQSKSWSNGHPVGMMICMHRTMGSSINLVI